MTLNYDCVWEKDPAQRAPTPPSGPITHQTTYHNRISHILLKMHVKTVLETILDGAQWSDAVEGGQYAQSP